MSEHGRLRRAYHRFLWKKRVEIIRTKTPGAAFCAGERIGSHLALACPEQESSRLDVQKVRCFFSGEPTWARRIAEEMVDGLAERSSVGLGYCRHADSVRANVLLLNLNVSIFFFCFPSGEVAVELRRFGQGRP